MNKGCMNNIATEPSEVTLILSYPSLKVGGPQMMILRLAEVAAKKGYDILLIDHVEGKTRNLLLDRSIRHTFVDLNHLERLRKVINTKLTYVLPLFFNENCFKVVDYLAYESPNTHTLLWVVHDHNFLNSFPGIGRVSSSVDQRVLFLLARILYPLIYRENRKLLDTLIASKGIVFMDSATRRSNEHLFRTRISEDYLPIPIDKRNQRNRWKISRAEWAHREYLQMLWISNFAPLKTNILIKLLKDLSKLKHSVQFSLNVAGSGETREIRKINRTIVSLGMKDNVSFLGVVEGERLEQEILHSDVLFAMGTSALEGAKLGIPTVLVDPRTRVPKNYGYRWLFESTDYCLGDIHKKNGGEKSLQQIAEELTSDNSLIVSDKCFEFTKLFDSETVFEKMIVKLLDSRFRIGYFAESNFFKIIKRSISYKIRLIKRSFMMPNRK